MLQNITWLAFERLADILQCLEADALHLAGFQQGYILFGDANVLRKLAGAHFAFRQHDIEVDDNGHGAAIPVLDDLLVFFSNPDGLGHDICNRQQQPA